jgi:hypothetical protein
MFKKLGSIYNMGHFSYQPIASRLGKGGHLVLIRIMKLKCKCNENVHELFLNPSPCFSLLLVIIKSNKLVAMETQTFLDLMHLYVSLKRD